ncbi:MAG: class I SAM-dependent methyltransferase [Acidobacteria bacterium]|nr:class I SAM-dependent methyltransferase [Acidobacteriota bacterium]
MAATYQALELCAFGGGLQRARTAFVDHLTPCRDVLTLGDGDGRFLKALLDAAPDVRVHSVDASARMLALAGGRLTAHQRARLTFDCADARHFDPGQRTYDAIVTMFFLDCFVEGDVERIVSRILPHLRPGGLWLYADFAIPPSGAARMHARVAVSALYRFFRWRADLEARTLPPSEAILQRAGLSCLDQREFRAGLIRSAVYRYFSVGSTDQ